VRLLADLRDQVLARAATCAVSHSARSAEALVVFDRSQVEIDVLLADANASGSMNGFELAQRVRRHRSSVDVVLVGTLDAAAVAARDICDEGPLRKPYEPQALLDRIKLLRAARRCELGMMMASCLSMCRWPS
jgi:DNA-binding response OmpR family regulator